MSRASLTIGAKETDDSLLRDFPILTEKVTIITGQNLTRGAVLGKRTADTVAAAVAGGNTGDGAFGAATAGNKVIAGTYTMTCIVAATNAGLFSVQRPDGTRIADATVAVAYVSDDLNFTIADGSADFIVGDSFTILVSGDDKALLSASAAVEGSAIPVGILTEDTDASAADVEAIVYTAGAFREEDLVIGTGHTAASIREGLRDRGIHI